MNIMSVAELKERHTVATETVSEVREGLKQKRLSLLDMDGAE
jgi:guanine nucleotide-binding protein G(I)/G(S)/G(T) subunit beta-1